MALFNSYVSLPEANTSIPLIDSPFLVDFFIGKAMGFKVGPPGSMHHTPLIVKSFTERVRSLRIAPGSGCAGAPDHRESQGTWR